MERPWRGDTAGGRPVLVGGMRRAGRPDCHAEPALTTATPWQWIPAPLLASGVYQGVLESAGIAFTPPSMAEIYGAGPQDGTGEQPGAIGRR